MSFVVIHIFSTFTGRYKVMVDFGIETVRLYHLDDAPIPDPTEAEFGFNWGDVIRQRCNGTTLQRVIAQEDYPFAAFSNVLDSPECGVAMTQTTQNLASGTFSGLIYRGTFVNIETTRPDNANIQQICTLDIYDTEFDNHSTFNTQYIVKDNGNGTQTVYISWSTLPDAATSASVGYSANGVDWTDIIVGRDSPVAVIIPTGEYFYSLILDYPGDTDPRYLVPVPTIIPLEMTDRPVMISVIDNDEDAFTPVRSKQLEAEIYSGNGVDISTFAQGGDQRYYTEYFVADQIKFKGWLSISDLSQDFMPDPNVINLVATDGLGFLSDIPLTDFDGNNPTDENQIMDYLAWSLGKTGLHLDIIVCMNIRERFATPLISDDSGDGHFYKWEWLDAKTFEKEIGVSEDCRTTLESILKEGCSLYQDNGTWFIMRKDEFEIGRQCYLFKFDWQGTFIEATQEVFEKSIGVDLPMAWMNDDAQILLERPFKSNKEIYKYVVPLEIPCNVNYERGEETTDVDVQRAGYTAYEFDCWSPKRLWGSAETTASFKSSIQRAFNEFDDETQRFIMLTKPASETGAFEYIRSSPIPLGFMDRFTFRFDASALQDSAGSGNIIICMIVLYGADGSVWVLRNVGYAGGTIWDQTLGEVDTVWKETDEEISLFRDGMQWAVFDDANNLNKTEWASFVANAAPLPVDGEVYVHLFSANQFAGTFDDFDIRYQNLQFEYRHYIGGSYRRYTGQYHRVDQAVSTVAVRENEVFISDSPKKLFKGALIKESSTLNIFSGEIDMGPDAFGLDGDYRSVFNIGKKIRIVGSTSGDGNYTIINVTYTLIGNRTIVYLDRDVPDESNVSVTISILLFTLANRFYDAAKYPNADFPDESYVHPFGWLQAFDVWNQINRLMRKFDGTVDGMQTNEEMPDLKYQYFLTDVNVNTDNKMFMLVHFEQNHHTCEWNGFLTEVSDSTVEKVYTGNTFKYITGDK